MCSTFSSAEQQKFPAGYRYRMYPNEEQVVALERTLAHCRAVWNWAVGRRFDAWEYERLSLSYAELSRELTDLRGTDECWWLWESSSVPQQQTVRDVDRAFQNWWHARARKPRFRSKRRRLASARWTRRGIQTEGDPRRPTLSLAGVPGNLEVQWSRDLPSSPRSITVTRDAADRWFISFRVTVTARSLPAPEGPIGIDLGIRSLAVLSTGERFPKAIHLQSRERRLKRLQRSLARKKPGSKNRARARRHLARAHARIADARRDSIHKLTTQLVRRHSLIATETLNVAGLRRNSRLAKAIAEASWGEILRQISYKALWYQRTHLTVDRWTPTSKTCSRCGQTKTKLNLRERTFNCDYCNYSIDRDLNAARNVLAAGLAESGNACGEAGKTLSSGEGWARLGEAGSPVGDDRTRAQLRVT